MSRKRAAGADGEELAFADVPTLKEDPKILQVMLLRIVIMLRLLICHALPRFVKFCAGPGLMNMGCEHAFNPSNPEYRMPKYFAKKRCLTRDDVGRLTHLIGRRICTSCHGVLHYRTASGNAGDGDSGELSPPDRKGAF